MRVPLSFLVAGLAALAAGGCSSSDEALGIAVIGEPPSAFEAGVRLSPAGQLVRAATAQGLVAFDETGDVVPALAERWIVTDDGLSYIFRLRLGAWPDGTQLTGESAAVALRRALTAVRGTPLAADIGPVEAILARTGRVVEIRLGRPNPNLLQLLAQPELGLLRRASGSGPMGLRRSGDVAFLTPYRPNGPGLGADTGSGEAPRSLRLAALPAAGALAGFRDGDYSVVLGGRWDSLPLAREVGLAQGSLQFDPVAGLFGLTFTHASQFLGSPQNREAIAMAIDRAALAGSLKATNWVPATRIVPAGIDDDIGTIGERWPELDLDQRRAEAAARVSRWKPASARPVLRLALPATPGADIMFDRLASDLQAIGLRLQRVKEGAPADLRLVDLVARYQRPEWYLRQLACGVRPGPCSPAADRLVAQADGSSDPAARAALLAEAEAELTAANSFVPLGPPIRWSLLRRGLSGFTPNRWAAHPLIAFALAPK